MTPRGSSFSKAWIRLGVRWLPFADVATEGLPLPRLLRLSLFQVSVGMAMVLLTGTLNRVMIVELSVPASVVAVMVALPILFAPARALIGHRSDNHRSFLGWRRVPYIWMGTLLQFGGFAIMPFALLVLSGGGEAAVPYAGVVGAALAFLLVGAGLHTVQTAGLALACDLAPAEARPRVVALLYTMLLVGMLASAVVFSALLADFGHVRLIQVVQGAAAVTMLLNLVALWKQEGRSQAATDPAMPRPGFAEAWRRLSAASGTRRLLLAVALGTAGFTMQDLLLEPYGGEVLALTVGQTTMLTALLAGGTIIGLAVAAKVLGSGFSTFRLAAFGLIAGIAAFVLVSASAPFGSTALFRVGTALIGFGGGLFTVGLLTAAMELGREAGSGLALGAWGAVQATAAGLAIATGGIIRDGVSVAAERGLLGPVFDQPAAAYGVVYHLEIVLLFAALAVVGPLARFAGTDVDRSSQKFGLAQFPG
jgi:BCD family chlorophyll transporter-like MFS transporter